MPEALDIVASAVARDGSEAVWSAIHLGIEGVDMAMLLGRILQKAASQT